MLISIKNERQTIFSPCRKYRYTLWREFGTDFLFDGGNKMKDGFVQFIGLNPSTADETLDDATIRRCVGFAWAWGYGAMCMTNLFAFRATQPEAMKAQAFPIGTENTNHLIENGLKSGMVVAAWGVHGTHLNRDESVRLRLKIIGVKLHHLGLTKDGHPKHPLYLKVSTVPTLWT